MILFNRGFTLDSEEMKKKINYESMSKILFETILEDRTAEPIETVVTHKIRRKMKERKVYSVNEGKQYRFNYFKNKITKELKSEPWGF